MHMLRGTLQHRQHGGGNRKKQQQQQPSQVGSLSGSCNSRKSGRRLAQQLLVHVCAETANLTDATSASLLLLLLLLLLLQLC
jgi:hypothetical protein